MSWQLREELRRRAENIIKGREAFEKHQLGGRKSTKPLQKIELDPYEVLAMLGVEEETPELLVDCENLGAPMYRSAKT